MKYLAILAIFSATGCTHLAEVKEFRQGCTSGQPCSYLAARYVDIETLKSSGNHFDVECQGRLEKSASLRKECNGEFLRIAKSISTKFNDHLLPIDFTTVEIDERTGSIDLVDKPYFVDIVVFTARLPLHWRN